MIETYFTAPHVLDRMRSGPIAPDLDTLATELHCLDYSRKSIRRQLRDADAFAGGLSDGTLVYPRSSLIAMMPYEKPSGYIGTRIRPEGNCTGCVRVNQPMREKYSSAEGVRLC